MKLNLGCGSNKIEGFVNIDIEESCKPDLIHDFTKQPLPFDDNSIEEVVMFHTIEHINKRLHPLILSEVRRVLQPSGLFIVSFPEFSKCVENWFTNKGGQKEFWEATIFGRQLYPSDFHVCIMDSHDFAILMKNSGFDNITSKPEPNESYNSFITAHKGELLPTHDEIILKQMEEIQVVDNRRK
ncbi:MAG: methyltransferase domain-containing protein [Patescibacteria group bacterium]|nr:methyltransferase domain-containing protein [Patescibacteria group bacterium]